MKSEKYMPASALPAGVIAPALPGGRWVEFVLVGFTGKTWLYEVRSREHSTMVLGWLKWYGPWRCYAFFAAEETVFETDCLASVQRALAKLKEHRQQGVA